MTTTTQFTDTPVLSGEGHGITHRTDTTPVTMSFATDPQHRHSQQMPNSPASPTRPYPIITRSSDVQHPQQSQSIAQAGIVSPGVTFADDHCEQYDSDMEAELDMDQSQETLHEGQILKSGYLIKKGERIKIWKKKWFVLRTSKLAYYKDSKEYVLLRIIDIRDIHKAAEVMVKNKTGVFVILTPKRTFTVQADSVAEMEEWIQAINQAKMQYDLTSSSDIELSHPGSNAQQEVQSSSAPQLGSKKSDALLSRRPPNPMSISDSGLLALGQTGRNLSPPSPLSRNPDQRLSGLSLGIMSQSAGQMPAIVSPGNNNSHVVNTGTSGRHLQPNSNRTGDGLSLITSGTQAIRIGGLASPSSPAARQGHHDPNELPANSFSSNQSFIVSPCTPNSPGFGSGGDQFGMGDHNVSSEEEDVADDPTVLEAGRVAAAANAPGSGLVTGEQLESKVVRQGYLLKLGKTYKTWRKKWFVLRGDKLTYYKNAKEYQPLGIIPLSTIIDSLQTDPVSKHKQYCLRIVTSSKKSIVLCAPDEDTLLQWIDALHVECARVTREAKSEQNQHSTAADDDILSDSRAIGRVAHMDHNPISPRLHQHNEGSSSNGGSGILNSNVQLNKALNLECRTDGHSTGVTSPTRALPGLSMSFQSPPSSRPLHEGSTPTTRNPPTVTFNI
ncbi:hypothetical protein BX616_011334 [Lobosporangium transversale]|uniref:PH domain-containing protein n=1 Tax=Lobosporangium transversale TaxID=64571 RepID=A0A1Y2GI74_9FUNG|nr:hypothetical protein BCR41DRAFT_357910 [Lobosporangium transversale]KAF9908928.1 hypothetical protein BX616_011334 [Lobosporangium transversale]ORZ10377.1 hypothetical protein BCR41DRAFT_357910 [Lobosporangium transversale]|eukprot:XP_021879284.1 hypothetical protein BCR41DRAFT_357910 [Lobosporangium transversale]